MIVASRCSFLACLLACGLTACAGVPPLPGGNSVHSRVPVTDIVNEISCELSSVGDILAGGRYFASVLLTLQVDDSADFTPSLSAINPLTGSSTFAASLTGDLGGQRQRTFTTTYTIDAVQLVKDRRDLQCSADGHFKPGWKPYSLAGDLGLKEIVYDGIWAKDLKGGIIQAPSKAEDKAAPTFGSKVQFIVTETLVGAGPLWTIKHFKGPSGQNGLINGKRLDTDSILITFAPQFQPKPGVKSDTDRIIEAIEKSAAARRQTLQALETKRRQDAAAESARQARAHLFNVNPLTLQADRQAREAETEAETSLQQQADDLDAKIVGYQAALAAAPAPEAASSSAAIAASRELLTNMLLQNLGTLH